MAVTEFTVTLRVQGDTLVTSCPGAAGAPEVEFSAVPWGDRQLTNIRKSLETRALAAAAAAIQTGALRGKASQLAGELAGGPAGGAADDPAVDLRACGRELFDVVFKGTVRAAFYAAYRQAREEKKDLRIRMKAGHPSLAVYPFELMYSPDDPLGDTYLALVGGLRLVRDCGAGVRPLPPVAPPLRILVVVASPRDLPPLNVGKELAILRRALDLPGGIETRFVSGPDTAAQLQRHGRDVHILHFVGHGHYDEATGQGMLIFENHNGQSAPIRGVQLANLLNAMHDLRLVTLNCCQGGVGNRSEVTSGVATSIVRFNVPAVVAMQCQITDPGAIEFSREFYGSLTYGESVDAAMTKARQQLDLNIQNTPEWATPVLYLAPGVGDLFGLRLDPADLLDHARRRLLNREWQAAASITALIVSRHRDGGGPDTAVEDVQAAAQAGGRFDAAGANLSKGGAAAGPAAALADLIRAAGEFPLEPAERLGLAGADATRDLLPAVRAARALGRGDYPAVLAECGADPPAGSVLQLLRRWVEAETLAGDVLDRLRAAAAAGDWAAYRRAVATDARDRRLRRSRRWTEVAAFRAAARGLKTAAAAAARGAFEPALDALAAVPAAAAPPNLVAARAVAAIGAGLRAAFGDAAAVAALQDELRYVEADPAAAGVPFLPAVRDRLADAAFWAGVVTAVRGRRWDDARMELDSRLAARPGDPLLRQWKEWCLAGRRLVPRLDAMAAGPLAVRPGPPRDDSPYEVLAAHGVSPASSLAACRAARAAAGPPADVWDAVCDAGRRLEADFALYAVRDPDRVRRTLDRLFTFHPDRPPPAMAAPDVATELGDDAGTFHALLGDHEEAVTFFHDRVTAAPGDLAALRHLGLAAEGKLWHLRRRGENPDVPTWEGLVAARAAALADHRAWAGWAADRGRVYGEPVDDDILRAVWARLRDAWQARLADAPPGVAGAARAEAAGAAAAAALGGIPLPGGGAAAVGRIGARAFGLTAAVAGWAAGFDPAAVAGGGPEREVCRAFSELAVPLSLLRDGRPDRVVAVLTAGTCRRCAGSPALRPGAGRPGFPVVCSPGCPNSAAANPGFAGRDALLWEDALLALEQAHFELGREALAGPAVDRDAVLGHWDLAVELAAERGGRDDRLRAVRGEAVRRAEQLGRTRGDGRRPALAASVDFLEQLAGREWDDPAGTLQRELVDAYLDYAIELANQYNEHAAARDYARRGYRLAPTLLRAVHSFAQADIHLGVDKYHGGELPEAVSLVGEAEQILAGADGRPDAGYLDGCREGLRLLRQMIEKGVPDRAAPVPEDGPPPERTPADLLLEAALARERERDYRAAVETYARFAADDAPRYGVPARTAHCFRNLIFQADDLDQARDLLREAERRCPGFAALNPDIARRLDPAEDSR